MNQPSLFEMTEAQRATGRGLRNLEREARLAKRSREAAYLTTLTAAQAAERTARRLNKARLRVKLKSLADEARIIRAEERRNSGVVRNELHHHRTRDVRMEARASHLIYGLIRGLPLDRIETRVKGFKGTTAELDVAYPPALRERLVHLAKKYARPVQPGFTLPAELAI